MKFTESFRMEKAYFQKLKSDIDIARSYIAAGAVDQARAVLESIVDVDGAVLLLYRNLGECWADLSVKLEELKKALQDLDGKTDKYHDELNEKIDEINNYLMALIREITDLLDRLPYAKPDYPVVYTGNIIGDPIQAKGIALEGLGNYHFRYGGYFELGNVSDLEDKVLLVSGSVPVALMTSINNLLGATRSEYQVYLGFGIRTGFYFSANDSKTVVPRDFCYFTRNDGIRDKDERTDANILNTWCTPIALSNIPQKYPDETRKLYCYAEISFYIKALDQVFSYSDIETLSASCNGFESMIFRLAEK